ncbi:tail fiber assembly protein [Salmonella enterica subsp. enterica]|uniref:Tail fiber assembly protein n=1 Tax=Salmonella enterica TaxID=28901 RepID=A0A5U5UV53_SALER|nr:MULTISPECIES: tail fiber assembly protein [Enterobacteriaceae]EAA8256834.1 tail fiber assembly protein [Salmonella enterica subsp. enterica]EAB7564115.1 tail fiber assembly protein [Salmonella enterica subsp. enterica serovar Newport]EAM2896641.1 tail fiber assembly protein [Salmonella enterica]EBV5389285.1 tail fiber assembly protein [Salmonella enterica subsp. enterica serovar Tananarive]EDB4176787.1 tail fiber assembly protein [Salmonella enterica subsp. enterica serovar Poona]EGZ398929
MSKYHYSAKESGFYFTADKELYEAGNGWPDDAIPVSDEDYQVLLSGQQSGMVITAGSNGYPFLAERAAPSPEQLLSLAIAKKAEMMAEASAFIAPLKDALDGGYIDDADKPKLVAWQKYRYELTKIDPAKPEWPEKPE